MELCGLDETWFGCSCGLFPAQMYFPCPLNASRTHHYIVQVVMPKTMRTHCRRCKKHTTCKIGQAPKGKASLFAQGKTSFEGRAQAPLFKHDGTTVWMGARSHRTGACVQP